MLKAPKAAAKARSKPVKKEKEKDEPRQLVKQLTPAQKKQALRALMQKANSKAKHTVMAFADDVQNPYFLRRPSGIMQLDIDTGGGVPAGGLSMISGPDNAGKTYVMFKYFAMHQRLYGNDSIVGYAPTEMAPDYWFMRDCGMKVAIPEPMIEERQQQRKLMGLPQFTKEERAALREQVGEVLILTGHTAEDLFDVVFASVRDNIFGIIGIDSFTMAAPETLMNLATFHDNPQMAAAAGLTTKFLTKFSQYMLGVDGTATGSKIVPIRSACAVLVSSQDANRQWLYLQQQTVSAEGFSGTAFSPYFPHTVRATETKRCTDCHVSEAGDNNAVIAHGLANGGNVHNGMPLSFNYGGQPITHENDACYLIPTLEGTMRFNRGDMLITGVKGEIYPCKPDIFEATYEPVTEAP